MPCSAPPRGFTDTNVEWSDLIDNNPCGKPDYADGLCAPHWQMKNGLFKPSAGVDQYAVFLLHADGADGSTTFADSALTPHPISAISTARISTAQSKFGGSSAQFPALTGPCLSVADSPDWDFGAGDFTIDGWVNLGTLAGLQVIAARWVSPQFAFLFRSDRPGNKISFYYSQDGTTNANISSVGVLPADNTWTHLAVVRSGGILALYMNGAQVATGAISGALFDSNVALTVGAVDVNGGSALNGWMDELRISKGIARWTSNFSVPTAPYT